LTFHTILVAPPTQAETLKRASDKAFCPPSATGRHFFFFPCPFTSMGGTRPLHADVFCCIHQIDPPRTGWPSVNNHGSSVTIKTNARDATLPTVVAKPACAGLPRPPSPLIRALDPFSGTPTSRTVSLPAAAPHARPDATGAQDSFFFFSVRPPRWLPTRVIRH